MSDETPPEAATDPYAPYVRMSGRDTQRMALLLMRITEANARVAEWQKEARAIVAPYGLLDRAVVVVNDDDPRWPEGIVLDQATGAPILKNAPEPAPAPTAPSRQQRRAQKRR